MPFQAETFFPTRRNRFQFFVGGTVTLNFGGPGAAASYFQTSRSVYNMRSIFMTYGINGAAGNRALELLIRNSAGVLLFDFQFPVGGITLSPFVYNLAVVDGILSVANLVAGFPNFGIKIEVGTTLQVLDLNAVDATDLVSLTPDCEVLVS